jgi:hypothetical protein
MYQVTGDVTAHYSTISIARTGFSHVLTLSALKVMCMTFNITIPNPNPNNGTWYIVHKPFNLTISIQAPRWAMIPFAQSFETVDGDRYQTTGSPCHSYFKTLRQGLLLQFKRNYHWYSSLILDH